MLKVVNLNDVVDNYQISEQLYNELLIKVQEIIDEDVFNMGNLYDELMIRFEKEFPEDYSIINSSNSDLEDSVYLDLYEMALDNFMYFVTFNEFDVRCDLIKNILDSYYRTDYYSLELGNEFRSFYSNYYQIHYYNFTYNNKFISRNKVSDIIDDFGSIEDNQKRFEQVLNNFSDDVLDYYYSKVS